MHVRSVHRANFGGSPKGARRHPPSANRPTCIANSSENRYLSGLTRTLSDPLLMVQSLVRVIVSVADAATPPSLNAEYLCRASARLGAHHPVNLGHRL
jgi:hypothetical protein